VEGIPLQNEIGDVGKIEPYWALRGLAMICSGYAMLGTAPRAVKCTTRFDVGCFVCPEPLTNDDIEILHGICCKAKLHRKCFEPFAKERDRIIEVYDKGCILKVYMLPLGDCRIVIARMLIRMQSYEEIFRDMFTTAP
jgi:hypothetical protein